MMTTTDVSDHYSSPWAFGSGELKIGQESCSLREQSVTQGKLKSYFWAFIDNLIYYLLFEAALEILL